ncbi:MAG: UDP-N-acetylmuramoyl-L-alanyl-D-glutamate--2,6-diaminopimelate ligase [Anaerolineales bacterium]|nr:UDP-N-acetylmuramoyl-L-alanyl-D-glutamate--2,6-diaminopimelate ligase [Anaerolineales bacterium]
MNTNPSLRKIFAELPPPFCKLDVPDAQITGISIDSRAVKPGHLFVAMQGGTLDGHDYIQAAIDNGAVAVVGERDIGQIANLPYVRLTNTRQALTWIAGSFYLWPSRRLTMIGVTGTDGKTTTTNILYTILKAAGLKAGMISTVNAVIGDEVLDTGFHVTTPDAHDVQFYLAKMVEAGLTHVVLETTSHAWEQHRVDACEFDVGVVTNITHEHLDQHGSYENYRAAKARLFESLEKTSEKPQGNPRLAVLNRDDSSFEFLSKISEANKMDYGLNADAKIRAVEVRHLPSGIHFTAKSKDFEIPVSCKLVGGYNVTNCLAALTATIYGLGIKPEVAAQGIAALEGIPGRMERIDLGQNFTAIVDFAHTPNALKSALEAAREMLNSATENIENIEKKNSENSAVSVAKKSVITVFGSAGLRDKAKRRMMAEIGAELADVCILTAEDPRTESLAGILEEMAAGATSSGGSENESFWRIPDRGEAIRFAMTQAREGDVVLVCGKGHEQSLCFGAKEFLWDDRIAVRAALSKLLGVDGPRMPYLPTQDLEESEWLALK